MTQNVKQIGAKMSKTRANQWVKKYQQENPDAALNGVLFGKDILEALCNYQGSEGLWIFKGLNDKNEECFVLFAADADGNILNRATMKSPGAAANAANVDDDAANSGQPCPPACPTD